MGQCECRNQDTEREEIETADNNNDLDYYNFEDYNYEIELSNFHKILIVILNILTGGIGTMLVPFLNKKRKIKVMIIAGILIGIFQTLHFLHFFSLLSGIKFLEDFYESISDDKFLTLFFEVSSDNDKLFPDENEENEENEEKSSILGFIIDTLKLNLSETLEKKQRKKVLKTIFGCISGMSYSNSLFTILVNLVSANPDAPNYKLSVKIFLYNLFNPGVGFILSCFSLFPACDCARQKYYVRGIILSILGMIFGVLLMISPFSLGIGIYLVKLTDKMFTIFPIKITFIFIGGTGVITSFIFSGINQKTILEAANTKIKPLDIILGCGENADHLISEFGWSSFFKIILNMVIPGSGTLCLLCKYGCDFWIILVSIVQFCGGVFFFTSINLFFTGECRSTAYEKLFMEVLETTQKNSEDYTYFTTVFNYFYTMGLCFYFSGIILILVLDYVPKIRNTPISIEALAYITLSLLTGGLGFLLFLPAFIVYFI